MKQEIVFVDTGAWFALADQSDRHHQDAVETFRKLITKYKSIITTNLIIAEAYILIRRNLGHRAALTFLDSINTSPRIDKIYSDSELEQSVADILRKYQDQEFSYTDAVSFAVMSEQGTKRAFTFDKHFKTAGFLVLPR